MRTTFRRFLAVDTSDLLRLGEGQTEIPYRFAPPACGLLRCRQPPTAFAFITLADVVVVRALVAWR